MAALTAALTADHTALTLYPEISSAERNIPVLLNSPLPGSASKNDSKVQFVDCALAEVAANSSIASCSATSW